MSSMSPHLHFGIVAAAAVLAACSPDATPDASDEADAMGASSDLRPWAAGPWVEAAIEATSGDEVFLSAVWDIGVDSRGRAYLAH